MPYRSHACVFLAERQALPTAPLFVFNEGTFLSTRLVSTTFRTALNAAGLSSVGFSSLRIGAATSAFAAGLSNHAILKLGHWQSNAFKGYIRPHKQMLTATIWALARQV